MNEPPTLEHLAKTIDLPLKRLKEGFKQLYGDSVYGFLFQHKMGTKKIMGFSTRVHINCFSFQEKCTSSGKKCSSARKIFVPKFLAPPE